MNGRTPGKSRDSETAATSFAELRRQLDASDGQFYVTVRRDLIYALLAENERLREQVNSGRAFRESAEGLPEGTLPRV